MPDGVKQDWQPVSMITDRPVTHSNIQTVARQITESARRASGRTAAGAAGVLDFGGPSGSSLPAVLATGSPIATFLYTLSRADRLALFRYWARTSPMVGRAIELHSELPMSRVTVGPPKGPSPRQNKQITRIYESMCERLDILGLLLEIAREFWLAGDVYCWAAWDEETLEWDDVFVLPVEYMHSILHPFNRKKEIIFFARPLVDTAAIRRITDRDLYSVADSDIEQLYQHLGESVPPELREALNYGEAIPLNTNWKKGSYCIHISRNRPPNEEYGQALPERCIDTLLRIENLKNAQLQISSRNMNPKQLIYAPGVGRDQLNDLRAQVDLSLLEQADYPIITNYEVVWQTIGAQDRLLNVDAEYQTLLQDLAIGLGSTVDMLTGQASYGGQRITLEMQNTQYLTFRDRMRKFVEEDLFRPVAWAKGHYYREEIEMWPRVDLADIEPGDVLLQEVTGELRRKRVQVNIIWNHSTLRFNRVSIRDNAEVYDQLFQLHQKGSLAARYLLDLHNIDPEENAQALLEDMGTPLDPVFNDLIRTVYTGTDAAQNIMAQTDFLDRIIRGLKLGYKTPAAGAAGGMGGGGFGGGGGGISDFGVAGGGDFGGVPGAGVAGGELGAEPGGLGGDLGAGGPEGGPGGPEGGLGGPAGGAPTVPATAGRRRAARGKGEVVPVLPGRVLSVAATQALVQVVRERGEIPSFKRVQRIIQAAESVTNGNQSRIRRNKR